MQVKLIQLKEIFLLRIKKVRNRFDNFLKVVKSKHNKNISLVKYDKHLQQHP